MKFRFGFNFINSGNGTKMRIYPLPYAPLVRKHENYILFWIYVESLNEHQIEVFAQSQLVVCLWQTQQSHQEGYMYDDECWRRLLLLSGPHNHEINFIIFFGAVRATLGRQSIRWSA
jgi:hypothetical protein